MDLYSGQSWGISSRFVGNTPLTFNMDTGYPSSGGRRVLGNFKNQSTRYSNMGCKYQSLPEYLRVSTKQ